MSTWQEIEAEWKPRPDDDLVCDRCLRERKRRDLREVKVEGRSLWICRKPCGFVR